MPQALADLEPRLASAREAVIQVAALDRELVAIRSRVLAARSADDLAIDLAAAQRDLAAATQTRLLAREALVEIREQRLDGMAAEIARKLAVGACCPVCGSADHPSPASPASGAPDEATEREARREVDDLEVVVEAHAQQVRGLETRLAAALAEAGEALDTLLAAEADTLARLERARAAAATVDPLAARLDALLGEQDDLVRHREELTATASRLDTETAVLDTRLESLREQVRAVLPDGADLDDLTAHHQQVATWPAAAPTPRPTSRRARESAAGTQRAADGAASASGLPVIGVPQLPPGSPRPSSPRSSRRSSGTSASSPAPVSCSPMPTSSVAAAAEPPDLDAPRRGPPPRPGGGGDRAPPRPGPARARRPPPRPHRRRPHRPRRVGPGACRPRPWSPISPPSSRASTPTTATRCACPPTSWPTASARSSRPPTCGCPR